MNRLAILLFFFVCSCREYTGTTRLLNKKSNFVILDYYENESVTIKNYIFLNDSSFQYKKFNKDKKLGQDSIFNLFINALQKTSIDFDLIKPNLNMLDDNIENLSGKGLIRANKIEDYEITRLVDSTDSAVLIPVINILTSRSYTNTGGYTFSYTTFLGFDYISLIIYIVKLNRVIYKRQVFISRKHINHPTDENFWLSRMKTEYWDSIVKLVIDDYIKRIKK